MRRVLFEVFGHPIYAYGFCLGIALISGWALAFRFAERDGMKIDRIKTVIFIGIVGALLGAKITFLLVVPDAWQGISSLFDGQGLVAYGGYIGGIVVSMVGFRIIHDNFWRFADHAAPSFALGLAIVRVGCFLNGCDFGGVCDQAWAVSFPAGSPAHEWHHECGLIEADAPASKPVHPTQLYATGYGLALFAFLLWSRTWKRLFYGQQMMLFLGIYAVLRFGNEILRDDPQRGAWAGLSTSQWISLTILGFVAVTSVVFYRRAKRDPAVAPS